MTRERRLAIEMWEQIVVALENRKHDPNPRHGCSIASEIDSIKDAFSRKHHLRWEHQCWFCHYVRHDRRFLPSRIELYEHWNGCQKCPLYKNQKDSLDLGYDECGCTDKKETLWTRILSDGDVEAARSILELLKGKE